MLLPLEPLELPELDDPEPLELEPALGAPVAAAVAAAGALPACVNPKLARATPLEMVGTVTQLEEDGVVKAAVGVVRSPMV